MTDLRLIYNISCFSFHNIEKTNGGQTGNFGVIFLLFIDEAQAAWDSIYIIIKSI
jgi:hypothetical protein